MRMLMRNGGTVGGLLTFVAVLAVGVGFFKIAAAQQPRVAQYVPPGVTQPPQEGPPPQGGIIKPPPGLVPQPVNMQGMTIEQLVEYVADLKKQQAELNKQEAAAIAELRKKLKAVNEKLDKLEKDPADKPILPPPVIAQ